jgi:hypothetical protein
MFESNGIRVSIRACFTTSFCAINLLGFFPAILGCVAWPLLRSLKFTVRCERDGFF